MDVIFIQGKFYLIIIFFEKTPFFFLFWFLKMGGDTLNAYIGGILGFIIVRIFTLITKIIFNYLNHLKRNFFFIFISWFLIWSLFSKFCKVIVKYLINFFGSYLLSSFQYWVALYISKYSTVYPLFNKHNIVKILKYLILFIYFQFLFKSRFAY